jgi:hypothetical protein
LLFPLEIRAWGRTVIGRGFGTPVAELGGFSPRGLFACCVLTCFARAFAAVTAVAVAGAAFTALTVFGGIGAFVCDIGVSVLI